MAAMLAILAMLAKRGKFRGVGEALWQKKKPTTIVEKTARARTGDTF